MTLAPTTGPYSTTLPPTTEVPTIAPTTDVPTTGAYSTTITPTTYLIPSTAAPTTAVPGAIDCEPLIVDTRYVWFTLHTSTKLDPNPAYDTLIDIDEFGPLVFTTYIGLNLKNVGIVITALISITSMHGGAVLGEVANCEPLISISSIIGSVPDVFKSLQNFVSWSKVGYLDFTIDQSNVAGERPLDWGGWVSKIMKLKDKIIVYGQNGLSVLKPYNNTYGLETIHRIGLKCRTSAAGSDRVHFFIDSLNCLWKIDDSLTKLDYSEFLGLMTDPLLTYDEVNDLLYICDKEFGYVFSPSSNGFGQGPVNISGVGTKNGTLYVVSPSEITTPKFEICTDTYDLGVRKPKTVTGIEVGADLTDNLYSSVDFRVSYKENFRRIGWFLVNPDGKSFPRCYGVEFRFRLKSFKYEKFELDYIKVFGHIHGFSHRDTNTWGSYGTVNPTKSST